MPWLVVVVIAITTTLETMTLDTREAMVSVQDYIGSSSGRTTIDYPTYYLGTTWSEQISVSS